MNALSTRRREEDSAETQASQRPSYRRTPHHRKTPPPTPRQRERELTTVMRKWGHKHGQALKQGGLTTALSAEHFRPSSTSSKSSPHSSSHSSVPSPHAAANLSKRARAKAAASAASSRWKQAPNARGRIIDSDRAVRDAASREKYGDESRIAVVTGLGEGPDVVPDGLVEMVGDAASEVGIVERVVLHLVEPAPERETECLRVFVVFSGMAGAYRFVTSTKALGGREVVSFAHGIMLMDRGLGISTKAGSSAEIGMASSNCHLCLHLRISELL